MTSSDEQETNQDDQPDDGSVATRVRALKGSVIDLVGDLTESGKTMIAARRDSQRRDELLRELGEIHVAASADGAEPIDTVKVDLLIEQIRTIDDAAEDSDTEDDQ